MNSKYHTINFDVIKMSKMNKINPKYSLKYKIQIKTFNIPTQGCDFYSSINKKCKEFFIYHIVQL